MTNAEAIEWLKYNKDAIERVAETGRFSDDEDVKQTIESINMAISALEKQTETNLYDQEEIHHNCTVQVLRNSVTGDVSVGWWEEKEGEE